MQIRRSGHGPEWPLARGNMVSKRWHRESRESVSRARRTPREATAAGRSQSRMA